MIPRYLLPSISSISRPQRIPWRRRTARRVENLATSPPGSLRVANSSRFCRKATEHHVAKRYLDERTIPQACRYENLRRIVLRTSRLESSQAPGVLGFVPSRALATVRASSVHVKREPEPATSRKAHLRVLSDGWKRKHRLVLVDGDGSSASSTTWEGTITPSPASSGRIYHVAAGFDES